MVRGTIGGTVFGPAGPLATWTTYSVTPPVLKESDDWNVKISSDIHKEVPHVICGFMGDL